MKPYGIDWIETDDSESSIIGSCIRFSVSDGALVEDAGRKAYPLLRDLRDENFCNSLVGDAVGKLGGGDIFVGKVARQRAVPTLAELTTEQLDA